MFKIYHQNLIITDIKKYEKMFKGEIMTYYVGTISKKNL